MLKDTIIITLAISLTFFGAVFVHADEVANTNITVMPAIVFAK